MRGFWGRDTWQQHFKRVRRGYLHPVPGGRGSGGAGSHSALCACAGPQGGAAGARTVECAQRWGATVNRRPEVGGGGMASASGASDLVGSGAPPPGGGAQAAAAEEEEREVVRVRVKVRLTVGRPALLGCPGEGKAVILSGRRAGPEIWGVNLRGEA